MPLGEVLAEAFVHIVWEGFAKWFLFPVLRFPGAALGWRIRRGRTFQDVWEKGDRFQQGMLGVAIYTLMFYAWLLRSH